MRGTGEEGERDREESERGRTVHSPVNAIYLNKQCLADSPDVSGDRQHFSHVLIHWNLMFFYL